MPLEFQVLGMIRVLRDGEPVRLNAPKQRMLLAVLVARRGEPLSSERLIEVLWPDDPPGEPRKALHWHVLNLRRALGGSELLVHERGGFRMSTGSIEVDARRFESLVDDATACRDTDPDRARDLLTRALRLWRGPAFGELADVGDLRDEADRLDELRSVVTERLLELRLAAGQHREVVPDLTTLVGEQPYRDGLRRLLMLALYRCGRQADALRVYREGRRHTVEELGLEPSAALRDLERRILVADPTLDPPSVSPIPRPEPGSPLPVATGLFTGRRAQLDGVVADLDALTAELPEGAIPVFNLHGMPGVGKTTAAVRLAHRLASRYPDGQLFIDLHGHSVTGGAVSPAEALGRLLTALGLPASTIPPHPDDRSAALRSRLSRRRTLLLLDDAADEAQVAPLLPAGSGNLVIVTSRRALLGLDDAVPVEIEVLSDDSATRLFRRAARLPEPTPEQDTAIAAVVRRCGRLPLALRIAAARLSSGQWTVEELSAQLDAVAPHRLDAGTRSVTAAFELSYQNLEPATRRLFRLLAPVAGRPFTEAAAASLAALPVERTEPLLGDLVDEHLLEPAEDRHRFHDLVAGYAADTLERDESVVEREAAISRLLDHYLHSGHAAALAFFPHRLPLDLPAPAAGTVVDSPQGRDAGRRWLSDNYDGVLAAIDLATGHDRHRHGWQLAWTLTTLFERHGHWQDWNRVSVIALRAAEADGDLSAQAQAHSNLARACSLTDRVADARHHYREALRLFEAADDRLKQCHTLLNLAKSYEDTRQWQDAEDCARQAMAGYRELDFRVGIANAHNMIGWFLAMRDELDEALRHCHTALEYIDETDSPTAAAATWDSIGTIHMRLDEPAEALAWFRRARAADATANSPVQEARALVNIGDAHRALRDPESARRAWRLAHDIRVGLGLDDAAEPLRRIEELDAAD